MMTVFSPISVHVVMFIFTVERCAYTDVHTTLRRVRKGIMR